MVGFPVLFACDHISTQGCIAGGDVYASPSLGDFDDDGIMEVVTGSENSRLYLIRADGSHYRGWPVLFDSGSALSHSPPALGDINNDGRLEISVPNFSSKKLYVLNDDATLTKGFPQNLDHSAYGVSLADIDKDGKLEYSLLIYQEEYLDLIVMVKAYLVGLFIRKLM